MRRLRMKLANWLPGRWLVLWGSTVVDVAFISKHAATRRSWDFMAVQYLKTGKYVFTSVHPTHTKTRRHDHN